MFERKLSNEHGFNTKVELIGEQLGSYFGYSLLVVPKKSGDDILVGAPMFSGSSWDEGAVYYYKNLYDVNNTFLVS